MPATSDSALALASQLRSLSDPELVSLITTRELRESGIKDFFDLAEALLDPVSIQVALAKLDRPTLTALAALAELGAATPADVAAHLRAIDSEGVATDAATITEQLAMAVRAALATDISGVLAVPPSVIAQLDPQAELGLPTLTQLATELAPTALARVSSTDTKFTDHAAAETAFSTTTATAELLAELHHEPARELARGGVALPDSKRLASAMGVDLDHVPGLLEIAERAGLVALADGHWVPTATSSEWLVDSSGERWALLAAAWVDRLPSDIRHILRHSAHAVWGERLDDVVRWLFPAGGDWMRDRVAVFTRDAELLGITANQTPSTPGIALLTEGPETAGPAMAALFPTEVHKVYLQHDLSVVAPGPLAPPIDARLRTLADVESRALASSYRVSAASLQRAMALGETEATLREFLTAVSLSGIPQPLDYLLSEASARHGLIRVGELAQSGRGYVRSTDYTLLRALLVDHSVGSLGLVRDGSRLLSRFDRAVTFWTLSDARYPVAAENSDGAVVVLPRQRATSGRGALAPDRTTSLIERLRLASSADPDVTGKAWLSRQIDVAIRAKLVLTVTVQLPDGSTADYQLEPASVAGGRLRARDRKADIERTLPLASITAVAPAR
jgi:hypothetical protein